MGKIRHTLLLVSLSFCAVFFTAIAFGQGSGEPEEIPGDVLSSAEVSSVDSAGIINLVPKVRVEPLEEKQTVTSVEDIEPFLRRAIVLDNEEQYKSAPYILADQNGQVLFGRNSTVYVLGEFDKKEPLFDVYSKKGKAYKHPKTGESLGFGVSVIGTAEIAGLGNPSVFSILSSSDVIEPGSRLFPSFAAELPLSLTHRPATVKEIGYVLEIQGSNGILAGENEIIVISLGEREGLAEGDLLEIYRKGNKVIDPLSKSWKPKAIELPEVKNGKLLVYKTYEKISLAIVLNSLGTIGLLDTVKSP